MATMQQANAALRKLPAAAKVRAQHTMDATAAYIAGQVEARLPVLTGRLRRAVAWESRPRTVSAVVGVKDSQAFYWKYLEHGTVKMAARPVWRPVAEAAREGHQIRLFEALGTAADDIAREAQ